MQRFANLLWLIPALPLAGALALGLVGRRMPPRWCSIVACTSVGLSALLVLTLGSVYVAAPAAQVQTLWSWFEVGGFAPQVTLRLDALSLVMSVVITGVGFLIHVYSTEYMAHEEGYSRYFTWLNLFVAAMLVLVLADDLLLLFAGWEAVGLCSYLLIGFWYRDPSNGAAARKAMVMTLAGDMFLVIGLLLVFSSFGTSAIPAVVDRVIAAWPAGTVLPTALALLLLAGALGKSAQLPLQTWLPDAMAGPTPVSALIHAATMVTAGVYLIARLNPVFAHAPGVLVLVAWLGAAGLLLAGASALVQNDIKRLLAFSTVSQLGFMFMALGAGAWTAAVFHLFTHAFFKALLFLAAGAASVALAHERDVRRMGGLRTLAPWAFWGFLIGGASLAALPYVTAGFFSKDMILGQVWASGRHWLWFAGWLGAVLTAAYLTRVFAIGFLAPPHAPHVRSSGWRMQLPIAVLAVPSLAAGVLELPSPAADAQIFSDLLAAVLPSSARVAQHSWAASALAVLAPLLGIGMAWYALRTRPAIGASMAASSTGRRLTAWWLAGWGFDKFHELVIRAPYTRMAARLASDPLDLPFAAMGRGARLAWRYLSAMQDGKLRRYAAALAGGAAILLALALP